MDESEKAGKLNEEDEFEMPIDPADTLKLHRLCMHELGHYVAGRHCGAKPLTISITFSGPGKYLGNCEMSVARRLEDIDAVRKYLKDRVAILIAGTLGEHLSVDMSGEVIHDEERWITSSVNAYNREESSASDKNKADELLRMLVLMDGLDDATNCTVLSERMQAISDEIWGETVELMKLIARDFYIVSGQLSARITHLGAKVVITSAEIESYFDEALERADRGAKELAPGE
jgi:hypothetical protein